MPTEVGGEKESGRKQSRKTKSNKSGADSD
jgi:hypothetical protein